MSVFLSALFRDLPQYPQANFVLHILEFLCSNLGLQTGYPDWDVSWCSSVPPVNGELQSRPLLLPCISSRVHLQLSNNLTLHNLINIVKCNMLANFWTLLWSRTRPCRENVFSFFVPICINWLSLCLMGSSLVSYYLDLHKSDYSEVRNPQFEWENTRTWSRSSIFPSMLGW
jgi:hypothetical protein